MLYKALTCLSNRTYIIFPILWRLRMCSFHFQPSQLCSSSRGSKGFRITRKYLPKSRRRRWVFFLPNAALKGNVWSKKKIPCTAPPNRWEGERNGQLAAESEPGLKQGGRGRPRPQRGLKPGRPFSVPSTTLRPQLISRSPPQQTL